MKTTTFALFSPIIQRNFGRSLLFLFCFIFIPSTWAVEELSPDNYQDPFPLLRVALPDEESINNISDSKFRALVNFLKEFWQIWGIDNQRNIEFVRIPNRLIYKALKERQIDIAAVTVFNPEQDSLYSIPIAKFKQRVFRRLTADESDGVQMGIHSNTTTTLDYLASHIERQYYQDIDVLLAEYQKFDVLYSTKPWLLNDRLKALQLDNKFHISTDEAPEIYLHIAGRKQDRNLMYQINESLRAVNKTQKQLWADKYSLSESSTISLTLGDYLEQLSEQEKQYLLDHNQVYFPVTEHGFPPYIISQSPTSITERGFAIELAKLASQKTGLVFKPYYVKNVESAINLLNENKADLFIIAEYSKALEQTFLFSRPYLEANYSIIYRHDQPLANSLNALKNESIAAVRNFNATPLLNRGLPGAKIKLFDTVQAAIAAVAKKEVNAYIGRSLISSYIIKQQSYSNLTSQPLPDFQPDAKFAAASLKQNTSLITLINRTINSISANQFDDMHARWSKTAFTDVKTTEKGTGVYRYTIYILATTLVICLIIFWVYYRELQVRKVGQRKVEKALAVAEQARAEAEKSTQAKATFLARMSHEIRTPMNGVLGMAEALAFTKLDKEQKELLETLNGSARNLLALLNDVLDFSKMDADKLTLESVPVDIHALAKNIITGFSHYQKVDGLEIRLAISDKITHSYFTDPTRLTQVLNNLLSNAVKFTEKGSILLSVEIADTQAIKQDTYDWLHISVKDTGIGISTKNQALLFTPFIQADDEVTRKFGGTGLGLSICQEIVRAMGGEIKLESTLGKGSLFHFTLKFKRASIVQRVNERRKNSRAFHDKQDERFKHFRVLVAEDNLVNIKVLTAQLERLNIKAEVAEDGQQALDMHTQNPYDIIISDCHMPVLDGFELAKRISKQPHQKPLWLIAITADALSGAAEKCLAAGFNDYMAKPTPQEEVNNKLNTAYRYLIQHK